MIIANILTVFAAVGDKCNPNGGGLFGFPHWYAYLEGSRDANGKCIPAFGSLSDTWLIVAAIIEILLRVAALAAIAMVIYGGFQYATSEGQPEKTGRAKSTIVDALVGLAIAVLAAFIVTFIAGSIKK